MNHATFVAEFHATIAAFQAVVDEASQGQARYEAALRFVDIAEPTAKGGLARAYRTRAGVRLWTLDEVVRAAIKGELE